jgi:hypothetical protein
MKNTFKILGIIAIVAVLGLALAGCGGNDEIYLKVINQNATTIVGITVFHPSGWAIGGGNDDIAPSSEKTFTIKDQANEGAFDSGSVSIEVVVDSVDSIGGRITKSVKAGQTITVTLKADGTLE